MSKNVVIVHGCPDDNKDLTYNKHWIPWIKGELENNNFKVETPLMPTPWKAIYEEWKKVFEKLHINEETILVGHSCGCSFLVRWLGESQKKVKKLILVAPWKVLYGDYLQKSDKLAFYTYDVNRKIKSNVKEITIFTSNNEHLAGRKTAEIFHEAFEGKLIKLKNHGHYTEEDLGTNEFPELLDEILK